jgi:hypothetical protein
LPRSDGLGAKLTARAKLRYFLAEVALGVALIQELPLIGVRRPSLLQQEMLADVSVGSKAEVEVFSGDVGFATNSGQDSARSRLYRQLYPP